MGRFRGFDADPGWINRKFRDHERLIREMRAEKRTRFADIGDEFTMTPEGPKPSAPMPLPQGLTIQGDIELIKVVWSGSADEQIPTDFGRLAIHASKFAGYTPTQGTEVATISSPYGGSALYGADGGDTYYVRCAIASLRGDYGPFTDEVAITPAMGADGETFRGDVVGRSIAIATASAGTFDQTFAGTTFPAGWAHTRTYVSGSDPIADPEVTSTGVPTGSDNGSAMLFDFGPAGGSTAVTGTVTTSVPESVDAEVQVKFQHDTTPSVGGALQSVAEQLAVWLRADIDSSSAIVSGLSVNISEAYPTVAERRPGEEVTLGALTLPGGGALQGGEWYWLRFRAVAGRIEASLWEDGEVEPDPFIFTASDVLGMGALCFTWGVGTFLTTPRIGLDTYVDEVNAEGLTTGFTVNPDGTARATAAEIENLTVTGDLDAPQARQSGTVQITPSAANTPTKVTVTFDTPFSTVPATFASAVTTVPGTSVAGVSTANVTTTSMDVYVTRANTTTTTVAWRAEVPTQ